MLEKNRQDELEDWNKTIEANYMYSYVFETQLSSLVRIMDIRITE